MSRVTRRSRRAWFFVCDGADLLDLAGPWEVLGLANEFLGYRAYKTELFSPGGDKPVTTLFGLSLAGARALPARPRSFPDVAFIAGGSPVAPTPAPEAQLAAWLKRYESRIPRLVSICTGAFVLGEAGLLDGRNATTHWRYLEELQRRFPDARVVDEGIFVKDGDIWTSAGICAGIDLTLALVEAEHGQALAMSIAKHLVLFYRRSGRQAQFSTPLRRQAEEPAILQNLSAYVSDHIDEDLRVPRLARAVSMSPRTLSRWFRKTLGESPAAWVRSRRVEEARRLLEDTDLSLKRIATRTGLGDPSTLWRVFTEHFEITPAAHRERFSLMLER